MSQSIHVTVAAIIERDNKYLMVEETSGGRLVFNQPAGHLEPQESLVDAAIREVQEEAARTFHPEYLIGVYSWVHPRKGHTIIRFTYSGSCSDFDPEQKLDQGIERAIWLPYEALAGMESRLRSPMVMRCIEDYRGNKRYPVDIIQDLEVETAIRYAVAV